MNNNKLIRIYESVLDFDKAIENPKDFKKFNNNFIETNIYPLSETKEPELFYCILNMINNYPDKYSHKSNDYLTWEELSKIDKILFYKKTHYRNTNMISSFFKDFNPENGDYSIIFKYLKNVKFISNNAFVCCNYLKKIILPDTITTLEFSAFSNCNNLKSIELSKNITIIPDNCFEYCNNLKTIIFKKNIKIFGNNAFDNCRKLKNFTIPDTVTELGNCCFDSCYNFKEIIIPKSVSKICSSCFSENYNLKNLIIESKNIQIGVLAFHLCTNLKTIIIPKKFQNNIKNIFYGIDLSKVKITYI